MKCPECQTPYQCPCQSCVTRHPDKTPWVRNGDAETCSGCGLTKDMHEWMDIEYEQYQNEKEAGE